MEHEHAEYGNVRLPVDVELHGRREGPERFGRESPELLAGPMIVYKDVDRGRWRDGAFEAVDLDEDPTVPEEMS